jgi:hypothetical protein
MAKETIKAGDKVSWSSSQGTVTGKSCEEADQPDENQRSQRGCVGPTCNTS